MADSEVARISRGAFDQVPALKPGSGFTCSMECCSTAASEQQSPPSDEARVDRDAAEFVPTKGPFTTRPGSGSKFATTKLPSLAEQRDMMRKEVSCPRRPWVAEETISDGDLSADSFPPPAMNLHGFPRPTMAANVPAARPSGASQVSVSQALRPAVASQIKQVHNARVQLMKRYNAILEAQKAELGHSNASAKPPTVKSTTQTQPAAPPLSEVKPPRLSDYYLNNSLADYRMQVLMLERMHQNRSVAAQATPSPVDREVPKPKKGGRIASQNCYSKEQARWEGYMRQNTKLLPPIPQVLMALLRPSSDGSADALPDYSLLSCCCGCSGRYRPHLLTMQLNLERLQERGATAYVSDKRNAAGAQGAAKASEIKDHSLCIFLCPRDAGTCAHLRYPDLPSSSHKTSADVIHALLDEASMFSIRPQSAVMTTIDASATKASASQTEGSKEARDLDASTLQSEQEPVYLIKDAAEDAGGKVATPASASSASTQVQETLGREELQSRHPGMTTRTRTFVSSEVVIHTPRVNEDTETAAPTTGEGFRDEFDLCESDSSDSGSTIFTPRAEANDDASVELGDKVAADGKECRYKVLHRIVCPVQACRSLSENEPVLQSSTSRVGVVEGGYQPGERPIKSIGDFVSSNPGLAFVVIRDYSCHRMHPKAPPLFSVEAPREGILPVSVALKAAFQDVTPFKTSGFGLSPPAHACTNGNNSIRWSAARWPLGDCYPDVFLFHHRDGLSRLYDMTGDIDTLLRYLRWDSALCHTFRRCDELFAEGRVTADTIKYLYVPDEIIVSNVHGPDRMRPPGPECRTAYVVSNMSLNKQKPGTMRLDCWGWVYGGDELRRRWVDLEAEVPLDEDGTAIQNLVAYPLRFAEESVKAHLLQRGTRFWQQMRFKKHVAYEGWCWHKEWNFPPETRFMVDYKLYGVKVPRSKWLGTGNAHKWQRLDAYPESIPNTTSDLGDLALLLPADVIAHSLEGRPQWCRLRLDYVRDVKWAWPDPTDFTSTVYSMTTAANIVRSRIQQDRMTEEARRAQAKPLVLHVHGPPGSGKTTFARALAEQAQVPLLALKAATIASTPDAWAKFNTQICLLGSAWGCMLLLDDADALLAKRTPPPPPHGHAVDHQDLRIVALLAELLETFPGVVVLTSDSLTRDAMGASLLGRIHAAVRVPPPDKRDRFRRWDALLRRAGTSADEIVAGVPHRMVVFESELTPAEVESVFRCACHLAFFYKCRLNWECVKAAFDLGRSAAWDDQV